MTFSFYLTAIAVFGVAFIPRLAPNAFRRLAVMPTLLTLRITVSSELAPRVFPASPGLATYRTTPLGNLDLSAIVPSGKLERERLALDVDAGQGSVVARPLGFYALQAPMVYADITESDGRIVVRGCYIPDAILMTAFFGALVALGFTFSPMLLVGLPAALLISAYGVHTRARAIVTEIAAEISSRIEKLAKPTQ